MVRRTALSNLATSSIIVRSARDRTSSSRFETIVDGRAQTARARAGQQHLLSAVNFIFHDDENLVQNSLEVPRACDRALTRVEQHASEREMPPAVRTKWGQLRDCLSPTTGPRLERGRSFRGATEQPRLFLRPSQHPREAIRMLQRLLLVPELLPERETIARAARGSSHRRPDLIVNRPATARLV